MALGPNRSCEMAVRQLLVYLNEGCEWIVDIDLEKFFDNVPQDKLMSLVHDIINDGDTESLIRKYLKAGVMTPQGLRGGNKTRNPTGRKSVTPAVQHHAE